MENIIEKSKNKAVPVKRIRSKLIKFYVTPEEYNFIKVRMEVCHIRNLSLFLRKVSMREAIDVESSEVFKKILQELSAIGKNINQIAARVNATDNIYKEDIEELRKKVEEAWQLLQSTR